MINRIKYLREEQFFTQNYVAKYLHIKQPQYARYETGKSEPKIIILELLADLYNVSVDYILERTNIRKPYPRSK